MSKQSRLLAVDASVLCAAGEKNGSGNSVACAKTLTDILLICHRVSITKEVLDEWNKHQSNFSKHWRASMNGKKKLKYVFADSQSVKEQITNKVPKQNTAEKSALLKDAHLLATALATDRILVTADRKLHDLCLKHGIPENRLEWIKVLSTDLPDEKQKISARLHDLATTRPNPPPPTS